jgi:hypothetical protein
MISHDIEPIGQRYLLHLRPYRFDQFFDDITDFVAANPPRVAIRMGVSPRDKSHLQINLGKLRLPILTTVFVPEAPGELIISVNSTRAHEELLGLLRRLRKRKEEGFLDFGRV